MTFSYYIFVLIFSIIVILHYCNGYSHSHGLHQPFGTKQHGFGLSTKLLSGSKSTSILNSNSDKIPTKVCFKFIDLFIFIFEIIIKKILLYI